MADPDATKHETVLDIGAEKLGTVYAQALLAASEKAGSTQTVVDQLNELVDDCLANNPSLGAAFSSPRIDVEEKNRVLDRLFEGKVDSLLLTFLKVMAGRDRLGYIAAVRDGVMDQYDQMTGQVLAKVSTAVPLDDNLRSKIIEQLGTATQRKVRLQEVVDSDLIGGMVIRIGDTVFDSSVASRLDKIGKQAAEGFTSKMMDSFDKLAQ